MIDRAKEIVEELSENDLAASARNITAGSSRRKKQKALDEVDMGQLSLFEAMPNDDILDEIKNLDISSMTPLDAMNKLNEIQNRVKNRW